MCFSGGSTFQVEAAAEQRPWGGVPLVWLQNRLDANERGGGEPEMRSERTGDRLFSFSSNACVLSCVWLFATPWTVACQAPLSMGFSRQEYWSGLLFPSPDLPNPGIEPISPTSPALAGG